MKHTITIKYCDVPLDCVKWSTRPSSQTMADKGGRDRQQIVSVFSFRLPVLHSGCPLLGCGATMQDSHSPRHAALPMAIRGCGYPYEDCLYSLKCSCSLSKLQLHSGKLLKKEALGD